MRVKLMISNIAFKLYTYAWSVAVEPFFSLSGHSLIVFKKGFTLSSKRMDRYVGCSCAHLAHSSGSATPGHVKVQVVIAYDKLPYPLGQDTCFLHVKHLFGT